MLFHALVAYATLAPSSVAAGLLRIPLRKVPDAKHVAHLLSSRAPPRPRVASVAVASSAAVAADRRIGRGAPAGGAEEIVIHDLANAQYYGVVRIGTPPQEFEVVYDTGSADMWVPGSTCPTISVNCAGKTAFSETASASFRNVSEDASQFIIQYGSGLVLGTFGVDTVTLADDYVLEDQTFATVYSTGGLKAVYELAEFDGILGLAFPAISKSPNAPTVISKLAANGKGMFAFHLPDNADGELAIGGYNEERMSGDVHWVRLARAGYWLVSMDVGFGNLTMTAPVGGIMDTGTSLLYGPESQVESMLASLGEFVLWKFNPKINLYQIQCDADVPDLKFVINGTDYVVPGDDLVFQDDSEQYCFFGVARMKSAATGEGDAGNTRLDKGTYDRVPGDNGPVPPELVGNTWLVGDTFLRRYYTIYDYENERFGLAQLNH